MKKINKTYVLLVSILLIASTSANAQISKAEIIATGLTCSMCSNAINKQLKSLADVESVAIDLNTNTFTVSLKKNNTLSPLIFKENIEKAGFFIGSLVLTTTAETLSKKQYINVNNSKSGNTIVQIQIVDKGYVTDKEFKKLSKSFKNIATYASNNENDFHYKMLN